MATAVEEIVTLEEMDELKKDVDNTVVDESKENKVEEVKENKDVEDEEEDEDVEESTEKTEEEEQNGEKKSTESRETVEPDSQWGGKRRRKSVEQFKSFPVEPVAKEVEVGTGRGVALGDIPFVQEMLVKHTCEQLKTLHKILYNNTVGNKIGIKQRIRKFNGYSFTAEDTKPFNSVLGRMTKIKAVERKLILKVMGLNVSSKVEELLDFLMEPQDKGKKVVSNKTPKKSPKSKTGKRKSRASTTPVSKKQKVSQIYSDSDGVSDDSDEEKEDKKKDEKSDSAKVPSNNELKSKVKEVVGALDLDTISMKQAVSKVFECYPNVDLSEQKQYIKDQIKELLD